MILAEWSKPRKDKKFVLFLLNSYAVTFDDLTKGLTLWLGNFWTLNGGTTNDTLRTD